MLYNRNFSVQTVMGANGGWHYIRGRYIVVWLYIEFIRLVWEWRQFPHKDFKKMCLIKIAFTIVFKGLDYGMYIFFWGAHLADTCMHYNQCHIMQLTKLHLQRYRSLSTSMSLQTPVVELPILLNRNKWKRPACYEVLTQRLKICWCCLSIYYQKHEETFIQNCDFFGLFGMNVAPCLSHCKYNTGKEWSETCWGIMVPKKE
jgi:hypothetical protein